MERFAFVVTRVFQITVGTIMASIFTLIFGILSILLLFVSITFLDGITIERTVLSGILIGCMWLMGKVALYFGAMVDGKRKSSLPTRPPSIALAT